MIKLINDLTNESSTLGKIKLLQEFENKDFLKEVLYYTYNPFINFYIQKVKVQDTKGDASMNDYGWWSAFKTEVLDKLAAREMTGHDALAWLEGWMTDFDEESQELLVKIIKRDLRCNISAKTVNKVFPDLIPTFSVQLANTYDPEKKYKDTAWAASPKMDGLRCVYTKGALYSRNGKLLVGFDHIIEELKKLEEFDLIDGELYSHTIPFQKIQGIVLRNKNVDIEEKESIKFNIFAFVKDGLTTAQMIAKLALHQTQVPFKYLSFVQYQIIDNRAEEIYRLDAEYVARGFEGVMLRSFNKLYDYKRSDALLKFKSFKEADFLCVGVEEGNGKYQGMLGKIKVEGTYDGKKIVSECGSGFTDEDRQYFWEHQDEIVGHMIEIKFQGITDDGTSLRFPIFKGTKDDR